MLVTRSFYILSNSGSYEEFAECLQALVHHVQHKGEGKCQFHLLTLCTWGECPENNYV